jgi:hypothetical protein
MTRFEYRVTWTRDGWADGTWPKTKMFSRRGDAERFLAKLQGDGRPDLGRVRIRVDHRPVGEWAQGWGS